MKYTINGSTSCGECRYGENEVVFIADNDYNEAFFELNINFTEYSDDMYIFMPSCAYNGNKANRLYRPYPPMYNADEMGVDCEPTINAVPALNKDGSGEIEVTSGDMAVPCVGVFCPESKTAFLLYTRQQVMGRNIGFSATKNKISVLFPSNRKNPYRFNKELPKLIDAGIFVRKGEKVTSDIKLFEFKCESINDFFTEFFKTRKCLMSDERVPNMYTQKLWNIMEKSFNDKNWSGKYYCTRPNQYAKYRWAAGWCGGGMHTFPLMSFGGEETIERAKITLDYIVSIQSDSGFYLSTDPDGNYVDENFGEECMKGAHLVRKTGDMLWMWFKHFKVCTPKSEWEESAKKCADAFVKLYETHGKFGQFVNGKTGEMIIGSSCAGASAIGGLVKAAEYFGEDKYLEIAKLAGEMYYNEHISKGVSTGGPGEALCANDSESIFAFIDSFIALYENTKDEKWLNYAKAATHIASSWVVTYKYVFPVNSEFGKLGINTVGSVFANVQNKHSAPGICTSSGDSIYKLYLYTKDEMYLELIKDIASFIPQCVSTNEKTIHANLSINPYEDYDKPYPEGFINERVNMSDWQGFEGVGQVFYASCWCETSLLLTFAELINNGLLDW